MRRSCLTARIALNYACGSGANLNEMKHKEYLAALLTTVLGIAMRLDGHFVLCTNLKLSLSCGWNDKRFDMDYY